MGKEERSFITGADGQVYNSYQYDAFGVEAEIEEQLPNRIRYTGQQYDELTGQCYLRARYYNPVLGRFMQEDTYQNDGLNLYVYCKNNPVAYYDPSGYAGKATQPSDKCPPRGRFGEDDENSEIIHNDILDSPRTGSALTVDNIKPTYEIDPETGRTRIVQEFPATPQAHGFTNIVDNYAEYATKTQINNGMLYQLEGSLNGTSGRFEWIIQDGKVTHRMFIQDGTMNGVPIKP